VFSFFRTSIEGSGSDCTGCVTQAIVRSINPPASLLTGIQIVTTPANRGTQQILRRAKPCRFPLHWVDRVKNGSGHWT
jgi:hypothetical protein